MPRMIVVPLDGSGFAERALAPAGALAKRADARLVLVTSRIGTDLVEPEAYLGRAAEAHGIGSAEVVVSGSGAVKALQVTVEDSPDPVICMTSHGRSGVGHAVLGSIAEDVLREVAVPVLLVGPAVQPDIATRFDNVVVCTDGSDVSGAIVPVVASWVRDLRLPSWVVQVIESDPTRALVEAGADVTETAVVHATAERLSRGDGGRVNWDVLHGDEVDDAIVDYARYLPASLIAMATHGRTGLARFALGSTAASVVHRAPCPVLVVRPDGLTRE